MESLENLTTFNQRHQVISEKTKHLKMIQSSKTYLFKFVMALNSSTRPLKDVKTLLSIPNIEFGKLVFCINSNESFFLLMFLLLRNIEYFEKPFYL
jgi:hypothetical protein